MTILRELHRDDRFRLQREKFVVRRDVTLNEQQREILEKIIECDAESIDTLAKASADEYTALTERDEYSRMRNLSVESCMLHAPTGSGKTLLAIYCICLIRQKFVFVTDTKELVEQLSYAFERFLVSKSFSGIVFATKKHGRAFENCSLVTGYVLHTDLFFSDVVDRNAMGTCVLMVDVESEPESWRKLESGNSDKDVAVLYSGDGPVKFYRESEGQAAKLIGEAKPGQAYVVCPLLLGSMQINMKDESGKTLEGDNRPLFVYDAPDSDKQTILERMLFGPSGCLPDGNEVLGTRLREILGKKDYILVVDEIQSWGSKARTERMSLLNSLGIRPHFGMTARLCREVVDPNDIAKLFSRHVVLPASICDNLIPAKYIPVKVESSQKTDDIRCYVGCFAKILEGILDARDQNKVSGDMLVYDMGAVGYAANENSEGNTFESFCTTFLEHYKDLADRIEVVGGHPMNGCTKHEVRNKNYAKIRQGGGPKMKVLFTTRISATGLDLPSVCFCVELRAFGGSRDVKTQAVGRGMRHYTSEMDGKEYRKNFSCFFSLFIKKTENFEVSSVCDFIPRFRTKTSAEKILEITDDSDVRAFLRDNTDITVKLVPARENDENDCMFFLSYRSVNRKATFKCGYLTAKQQPNKQPRFSERVDENTTTLRDCGIFNGMFVATGKKRKEPEA